MQGLMINQANKMRRMLEESKGGNSPGITEDHRYEMLQYLHSLEKAIAQNKAGVKVEG